MLCDACFPGLLSWCVHSECLLVLEAGILGGVGRGYVGGEVLCDLLGMESDRKGRSQQGSHFRAGDETGGGWGWVLDLRSSRRGMGMLLAYLLP